MENGNGEWGIRHGKGGVENEEWELEIVNC